VQVFAMRWNIVIGGQLLSKSFRGLRSGYMPELFGREGILMAILLLVVPLLLLGVYDRVLPIFRLEEVNSKGEVVPLEEPAPAPPVAAEVEREAPNPT